MSADYRGVTVFKCGPWSQGPVFLQQLRSCWKDSISRAMGHNSAEYIHTVIEAAKLAFADREAYYADPEFVDVPMDGTAERSATRRIAPRAYRSASRLDGAAARRSVCDARAARRGRLPTRAHGARERFTSPAADRSGNMIAVTASGGWIPSSPVIDALGFPLGIADADLFSRRASSQRAAARASGRAPRLSPSLAMRKGEPYLAFGTPGGDQQDQWTLQFFLNVIDFGMDVQDGDRGAEVFDRRISRRPSIRTTRFPACCGSKIEYPMSVRDRACRPRPQDRSAPAVVRGSRARGADRSRRPACSRAAPIRAARQSR